MHLDYKQLFFKFFHKFRVDMKFFFLFFYYYYYLLAGNIKNHYIGIKFKILLYNYYKW